MSRILVVEDNDSVALGLKLGLEKEGFTVVRAARALKAQSLVTKADLVILDIRLPDGDGFDLCRWFRAQGFLQPILMLTARDDVIDKIVGLEVGADDYMTKPFELREVIARVRALLRRAYGTLSDDTGATLHLGNLELDLSGQRVLCKNEEIYLTSTEFKLLVYLAQHPDLPQSRQTLIEQIWGYEQYVGDPRTVDVHIRNLRRKIESDPHNPRLIITVRGAGYKLVGSGQV